MSQTFPFAIGTIHIIGIGGIGMSGYAEILHNLGYQVQGTDQSENANVLRLRTLGIRIIVGHTEDNILDSEGNPCSVVVKSTAVKDTNPEIVAAKQKDIPVIPRVALLTELMRAKWCINISGTHGKTTTTSLIGHVMEQANLDPTVINGGIINAYGSNTRMGKSNWMVVESDESDGTFAKLPSVASVITNIDPEHLDYYGSFDALKKAFIEYARNLPFYGIVIACIDHPVVAELLPQFQRKTLTYGFSDKADIQATGIKATPKGLSYDVRINNPSLTGFPKEIKNVFLPMFGEHNVLNSLAAFALGHHTGIAADKIVAALAGFTGVKRRFTITGVANGITVIDDYGHHPVEIAAVIKAGRDALQKKKGAKVIAIIQPHRYSRLSGLFGQFCNCAKDADEVIVADVYAAGEEPIAGADKNTLAHGMKKAGIEKVHTLGTPAELAPMIYKIANSGDFVICLGAGSITQWAYALPGELERLAGDGEKKASGAS